MTRSRIVKVALLPILFGLAFSITSAMAAVTDNLYPTANANWVCADYGVSDSTYCKTDNENLVYFFQSSSSAMRSAVRSTMNNDYGPNTDLTVSETTTPVYSGTAETDTIYQLDASGLNGAIGITWCQGAASTNRCDQHYVRYNPSAAILLSTACHETGHSVGLTHGIHADPALFNSDTRLHCMQTPLPNSEQTLGANNRENIDAGY